jgi:type II secretory ATPase GspE/PulE/Tfp pilus assembly ATPase PilB-like protein
MTPAGERIVNQAQRVLDEAAQIKEIARREGMRTLIEDGWRVVGEGTTTPAEVLRVSKDETGDALTAGI